MGVWLKNQRLGLTRRWLKPVGWTANTTSQAATTAGRARLQLIEIDSTHQVDGILFRNYATIAGNVIVGIYGPLTTEESPAGTTIVATSADTACAGLNVVQFVAFTSPVTLSPGRYYLASIWSDATHTYGQGGASSSFDNMMCYYDRVGGYGALTTPCPAVTTSVSPCAQLLLRSTGGFL